MSRISAQRRWLILGLVALAVTAVALMGTFRQPEAHAAQLYCPCGPGCNPILGTNDDDVLTGTNGCDCINGLGGDDQISGLGGDDSLCGGPGYDVISGGAGTDLCIGGESTSGCEI